MKNNVGALSLRMEVSMKKIYPIIMIVSLGIVLSACAQSEDRTVTSDKAASSAAIRESTAVPRDEDPQHFLVKNGTLLRYKGDFDSEKEIVLPSNVKKIGEKAFSLGKSDRKKPVGLLKTVHLSIPAEVALEKGAFTDMGPMKITFEEGRKEIEEDAFFNSVRTGIQSEVVLPDTVTTLKKRCFMNSLGGSFLTVKLGSGVEIIEDSALAGVYVQTIPDSVKKIGKRAFADWGRLPQELPEGVETLGSHFIDIVDGKIHIPSTVKKIEVNAVWWRDDAKDCGYIVAEDNPYYKSDEKGWLYSKDGKTLYYADLSATNYEVPDGIETVYKKGLHVNPDEEKSPKIVGLDGVKCIE